MAYAIVVDVAAGWEGYSCFAAALEDSAPDGLIVHAAGRTDEGFRIIDPGEGFRRELRRTLSPEHVVYGARESGS